MYHDYLILGGAGLVGLQVCRHIMMSMQPRRIVVASLLGVISTWSFKMVSSLKLDFVDVVIILATDA